MMDHEAAVRAEANREDGWPYPDDDSDLKGDPDADRIEDEAWEAANNEIVDIDDVQPFEDDAYDSLEESFSDFGFGHDDDPG